MSRRVGTAVAARTNHTASGSAVLTNSSRTGRRDHNGCRRIAAAAVVDGGESEGRVNGRSDAASAMLR